jgi:hypothetical protein
MDICAAIEREHVLEKREIAMLPSGFAVALPLGFEAQIRPRSGLAVKHGIGPDRPDSHSKGLPRRPAAGGTSRRDPAQHGRIRTYGEIKKAKGAGGTPILHCSDVSFRFAGDEGAR